MSTTADHDHETVGRFAPSPTGRMHAGNIFAALMMWLFVRADDGTIVLRIEDLDHERSKPEFADRILYDFEALGLTWDRGPLKQQEREDAYEQAFEELVERNLIYPCFCSRADLHAASAPHFGDKFVYPGTCRHLSACEREHYQALGKHPSYRLIVPDRTITFTDRIQGVYTQNLMRECGDFLVKRSDGAFAYQLAVVLDDAFQGVNTIVRGVDLLSSTPQQIYLQDLFGFEHPQYAHIPLIVNEKGRRLSKRDKDASLDVMMEEYGSARGVMGHIAYVAGLIDEDVPASPEEILAHYLSGGETVHFDDLIQIEWH